ncbi:MAG: Flp pilus assembly complex ATPase component [Aquificae bacterium]|nr:Flp pilus assembly complex ATPase component [Aquificota bacterium]
MRAKNVSIDFVKTKFPILAKLIEQEVLQEELLDDIKGKLYSFSDLTEILVYLIEEGILDEEKLKNFFVEYLGIEPFSKEKITKNVDSKLLSSIPFHYMEKKKFFPVVLKEDAVKIVALNPLDKDILHQLSFLGFKNIETLVGTLSEIEKGLETLVISDFDQIILDTDFDTDIEEEIKSGEEINLKEALAGAEEAPIVKATRIIILNAVKMGASDIHIEPMEKEVRIRYRVDGILRTYQKLPSSVKEAIIARYKIMANMDIAEKRLPQDGRIRVKIDKKPIDLRVSTIPTVYGEKLVMRIQDAESYLGLKLDDLGFEADDLEKVKKAIYEPWGMVLVTGPTGSGKTTTLYTVLMERNKEDVNIVTAEDPVEVSIPGINQVHIKEKIGLTFADTLRAFLRQDPDIILVGEIRDPETADISIKAALTGHLVFSTLHTNDAPSSITRLLNIGVEKFLVATAVNMIIAQRLVRKLCNECKLVADFPDKFWLEMGLTQEDIQEANFFVHNPKGCENCNYTGYKGRTAVHEVLDIDPHIRKMILDEKTEDDIRQYAREKGVRTLYENGLLKVKKGITDVAEIERVLMR